MSQRRASLELGISHRSLQRLMQDLNLKPYKPRLLQALNEDDPDRRLKFCEWILNSTQEDPTLLGRILWMDEATFQINGRVNRHNCVYWSETNPHFIIEQELNVPQVIVWRRIWSNDVEEHSAFQTMIWPQDGTPPHYDQIVRDYLDDTFVDWIDRRGTVECPPLSPHLTPCDFSLWGIMKDRVYAQSPRDVNHLKSLIKQEFTSLNNNIELCQRICQSVAARCQMCINAEGKQFEHLC
ncbi:unnamed protein product [Rotaria sp. Silwood1]|nr:unnamed protein product [Rotaria sp. Silwood1]CAF4817486.1 unnamed protein product [Rotaria sp. Silwood1]CAF4895301.1 unnamed protein product [Rotaria sp. Silwood1]